MLNTPPLKTRLLYSSLALVVSAPMLVLAVAPDLDDGTADRLGAAFTVGCFSFVAWKLRRDWKTYDEAQKEAHRWAFSVGAVFGLFAMLLALPVFVLFAGGGQLDRLGETQSGSGMFAFGALAVILPQVLGYVIAQTIWWRRRR